MGNLTNIPTASGQIIAFTSKLIHTRIQAIMDPSEIIQKILVSAYIHPQTRLELLAMASQLQSLETNYWQKLDGMFQ